MRHMWANTWPHPQRSILWWAWLALQKLMTMSHRSVATQTHWSWLKDLEEIARLKREHVGEVNLEMGSIQQMLDEEQSIRNPGASC